MRGALPGGGEVAPLPRLGSERPGGRRPTALLVACSDAEVEPELLAGSDGRRPLVVRNAGNVVPPSSAANAAEVAGTLEYAVSVLGIRDVVVCGHSGCRALQALLDPELGDASPAVAAWRRNTEAARSVAAAQPNGGVDVDALAELNAVAQLAHLRTHPPVAAAGAGGRLRLQAWFHRAETNQTLVYDPDRDRFVGPAGGADTPAAPAGADSDSEGSAA